MAALVKAVRISKTINNVTKLLTNLSLTVNNNVLAASSSLCNIQRIGIPVASFHTTRRCSGLMEFFDEESNWGQETVDHGRSWKKDELRIKSNEDLHKLWFVLLKERNMLMTMEHHYNNIFKAFPSPERIDRVQESMENLETVVRERNQAYHLLETGEDGERPVTRVYNQLGLKMNYRLRQYALPKAVNSKWWKNHKFGFHGSAVRKFLRKYGEVKMKEQRRRQKKQYRHVLTLLRKFPNIDLEALQEKFPDINVNQAKESDQARGHSIP